MRYYNAMTSEVCVRIEDKRSLLGSIDGRALNIVTRYVICYEVELYIIGHVFRPRRLPSCSYETEVAPEEEDFKGSSEWNIKIFSFLFFDFNFSFQIFLFLFLLFFFLLIFEHVRY